MSWQLLPGDCRDVLATLPAASVQCCVTSPPYWGLRDYGVAGQLGLEPTPEEYVAQMVAVFREVRRVLRDGGTLWLNLGDSYNAYNGGAGPSSSLSQGAQTSERPALPTGYGLRTPTLKPKDLVGIPWRVAFALQADGWWLRSDIIWAKPNPMPESVTDRPTKAHEYLFLLAKSERYYYDAEAIKEPASSGGVVGLGFYPSRALAMGREPSGNERAGASNGLIRPNDRNRRSVWTIATQPYPEAHFATFPPDLVKPCVMAGTSEHGACPECGAPWVRVVSAASGGQTGKSWHDHSADEVKGNAKAIGGTAWKTYQPGQTLGWRSTCSHDTQPRPCVVLDPFAGAGTAVYVAHELGRHGLGIELNPAYIALAEKRLRQEVLPL